MSEETKKGRIDKWMKGGEAPIWLLQIHPTNACNLNCRFCWRGGDDERNPEELSKEKWLSIIEEACKSDVKKITFSGGGEPTLRRDVLLKGSKIMEKHRKSPPDIENDLITNGTAFDEELIKNFVKRKWTSITFSIHGTTSETDDFIKNRKGALERTVKNIKFFNKWKEKEGTELPRFTVHTVLMKHNYDEILPMYKLCEDLNISTYRIRIVNEGIGSRFFPVNEEIVQTMEEQVEKVREQAENSDVTVKQEFSIEEIKNQVEDEKDENFEGNVDCLEKLGERRTICPKPFSELVILADGSANPCCVAAESQYHQDMEGDPEHIDNIKEKSLEEVWKGEKIQSLRERMKRGELPRECENFCTSDLEYKIEKDVLLEDKW
ncbi:MAG: radical SAM/SPASM domain-containing protein [Candidatus Aenigmatarchaeota archaeon]